MQQKIEQRSKLMYKVEISKENSMARRSDHTREELKELILEASWEIVGKEGFSGLTARRIAKDIGYAPGSIYNLFASMDDLYLAVNAMTMQELYKVLSSSECHAPEKSPLQNMKKMAALYKEFSQRFRPHWLMLFTQILPEGKDYEDWYREKTELMFQPLEDLLEPYCTPNQSHKKKMAARVLWASVHGLCFLEETKKIPLVGDQDSTMEMTDYLIDNFVKGLESNR